MFFWRSFIVSHLVCFTDLFGSNKLARNHLEAELEVSRISKRQPENGTPNSALRNEMQPTELFYPHKLIVINLIRNYCCIAAQNFHNSIHRSLRRSPILNICYPYIFKNSQWEFPLCQIDNEILQRCDTIKNAYMLTFIVLLARLISISEVFAAI